MRRLLRRVLFPVAAAALAATLFGCAKDDGDVTNPNPDVFEPKGKVQGLLTDSVTQQPIVGAVVDIGVATATTNERGQFVLEDVPANQYQVGRAKLESDNQDGQSDLYLVTVDLRGVKSPVDMKAETTTVKYPDFKYARVGLLFSSLDDTEGSNPGGGSGSNHDTPVNNLTANLSLSVGKLSAAVKGCVLLSSTRALVADADAYTVRLRASSGSDNSATGAEDRVLATAPVAGGQFTFSGIEALGSFYVEATNAAGTMFGYQYFSAGVDGTTTDLTCATGSCNAILVGSTDDCDPFILSRSVADGADLAPAANQTVVFTFSEPIKASAYALATDASKTATDAGGLWDDVDVNFLDGKAGNIAHTLAWSADMTQLTVTIAQTAVSSIYEVDIEDALDHLTDAAGNGVEDPRNLDYVQFSTNGGAVAAAPADLTVVNEANIDYNGDNNSGYVYLDWTPASGAKFYRVYCAYEQVWGATNNVHQFTRLDNVDGTSAEIDFDGETLVENGQIALQGLCYVVGVNSDGLEGAASETVIVKDVVPPTVEDVSVDGFTMPAADTSDTFEISVDFSEPMDEALAEDVANYAIEKNADAVATDAPLTILSAVYDPENYDVTLTVEVANDAAGTLTYSGNWTLTVSVDDALTDVAGNALAEDEYNNGVKVLAAPTLLNTAALGYEVNVRNDTNVVNSFNTVMLYDATDDLFLLPVTPYDNVASTASVPRLSWAELVDDPATALNEANATFTVKRYRKVLNGLDDWSEDNSWNVGHATSFVDGSFNSDYFVEQGLWGSLQHFPAVFAYQLEAHLADSSYGHPGSYALLGVSPMVTLGDVIGPYVTRVTAPVALGVLGTNDGLAYEYTVDVYFSEPVKLTDLLTSTNYVFSAAATVTNGVLPQVTRAEYLGDHSAAKLTVTLTNPKEATGPETNAPVPNWVLTVNNMRDLAGNTILASGNQWAADPASLTATTPGARTTGSPAVIDPAGQFNPF